MFDKFPFTNVHELNLDWILKILNKLKGGTKDQVLTRLSNKPLDFGWKTMSGGGGGGGTTDYNDLGNKPGINGVTLEGNKTSAQLNIPVGPELANTMPLMDGTPQIGSSSRAAKADHVHPSDTSKPSMPEVRAEIYRAVNQYDPAEADYVPPYAEGTLGYAIEHAAIDPEDIQNAVDEYLDDHPTISGTFTNAAKNALLDLLEKVAYIDGNGQTYLANLRTELFSLAITSISAVYTQGGALIYETDSLDVLEPDLVVTANYIDGTSQVVSGYTLSGSLTAGTSTITVTYSEQTTTFNVTVTAWDINWNYTDGLPNATGNPFTKTYTDGTATMTANGLECSGTNLGYTPRSEQSCSKLVFEGVFIPEILSSQSSANGNGVKVAVYTGTRATTVSINSKGICVYKASVSGYVVAYAAITTNTEYTIRIETDSSEGKIYLNGQLIYTVALASTSTTNSRVFAAASAGSGKTLFKRWSYKYIQ